MSHSFSNVSDDFFLNLNLQTTLSLPSNRETVLQFCETVQKHFSDMTSLYQRDGHEYVLEGDREAGSYQWLELHPNRLTAGWFNPPDLAQGYSFHRWLLERSIYYLGVGRMDVECLDITFGFHLDFLGNRDAIVTDALLATSPLAAVATEGFGKCIQCEPAIVFALDDDCLLQARLAVETHSNDYQVRTGQFSDDPISIYFTMRRCPQAGQLMDLDGTLVDLCDFGEDLASRVVVPQVVKPIVTAIASS